VNDEDKKV